MYPNEKPHNLRSSSNIIRVIKPRWAGHAESMGEKRNLHIFVRNPEENRPLQRPRRRWKINTIMYFKEIGYKGVGRIHVAHDSDQWWDLLNTVINLRVPYKAGNFLTNSATISVSRRTLLHGISELVM
jgi:hypothetical protein